MPLTGPGTFDSFFGSAVHGDAVSVGAQIIPGEQFFGTLRVSGPGGLEVASHRLFCQRLFIDSSDPSLSIDGAIHCNGGHATSVSAGRGAPAGFFGAGGDGGMPGEAGHAPAGLSICGAGGNGGVGGIGAQGLGAIPALVPLPYLLVAHFFTALTGMFQTPSGLVVPSGGGGGGGGGARDDNPLSPTGGPGGGAAGVLFVCAREIFLTGSNPHFAARGGNAAAAGGGAGSNTGGGGGGAGGAIILAYGRITGTLVTSVTGGLAGGSSTGRFGAAGQPGRVFPSQV
jgi:hypothetical protein